MANTVTPEELLQSNVVRQQIAERAYFMSEQQGFAPGREEEHWYTAEAATLEELLGSNGIAKKPRARKAAPQAEAAPVTVKTEAAATPRKTARKKAS